MPLEAEQLSFLGNISLNASNFYLGNQQIAFNPFRYDDNVLTYVSASNITNPFTINALNSLVIDLNQYNLWNKMYAIYPFPGPQIQQCKYNLKDITKYELAFTGSWNFSTNGVSGSGTGSYADTGFSQITASLDNWPSNSSIGIYSRNNSNRGYDFGYDGPSNEDYYLISRYTNDLGYFGANGVLTNTNLDSRGMFVNTFSGSGAFSKFIYKNGTEFAKTSTSASYNHTYNFYLGAVNALGTATEFSIRNYAFSFIGKGLSSTDASNLYTIVQNYQTALARQV